MSLLDEWDDELHRAEDVLEEESRRYGHLVLVPELESDDEQNVSEPTTPPRASADR